MTINWKKVVMPVIKQRLEMWANQQIIPTLRGLFYTLVSLNILENTTGRYDYLSKFTARARERSLLYKYKDKEEQTLPIDCFADNVRQVIEIDDIYETAKEFYDRGTKYYVKRISKNYVIHRWHHQPHYVEVWVEKDAMAGTLNSIINIAGKREVRIVPTRGQESVTFAWKNVKRLYQKQLEGKIVHIRYFGDLDPSGEAIEKELINKLTVEPYGLLNIDFKRVGVTNEQRIDFTLVPNNDPKTMSKLKRDSNRFAFMEKYHLYGNGHYNGDKCTGEEIRKNGHYDENRLFQIEVDAMEAIEPEKFGALVLESVDEFFDEETYQKVLDETPTEEELKKLAVEETKGLLASLQNKQYGSDDEESDDKEK